MSLRNRVVGMETMRLADLASHPKQPRTHSSEQLAALDEEAHFTPETIAQIRDLVQGKRP